MLLTRIGQQFNSIILPAQSPLGRLCHLENEAENPDSIRLLRQSITKPAIIYAVAIRPVICIIGRAKTILSLYQVDGQSKHAQNEKHLKSTKRDIKGPIRAMQFYLFVPGREGCK